MKKLFYFSFLLMPMAALAQNIGIGTTSPISPLTVISNAASKGIIQKDNAVEVGFYTSGLFNTAYVQRWSNHALHFSVNNGTPKISIATDGNVGINISTPTATRDVSGTVRLRGGTPGVGKILTSDASGNASWQPNASGNAISLRLGGVQSIPTGPGSVILFRDNVAEAFNDFPGSINNATGRFTVPAGEGGTYQLNLHVSYNVVGSFTGTDFFGISFNRNGSPIASTANYASSTDAANRFYSLSQIVKLNAGDYIEALATHFSGVSQALESAHYLTYLNIVRLK